MAFFHSWKHLSLCCCFSLGLESQSWALSKCTNYGHWGDAILVYSHLTHNPTAFGTVWAGTLLWYVHRHTQSLCLVFALLTCPHQSLHLWVRALTAALNRRCQKCGQIVYKDAFFLKYQPGNQQREGEQCWMGKGTKKSPVHKPNSEMQPQFPCCAQKWFGMYSGLSQTQWKHPRWKPEKSNFRTMTGSSLSFWGLGRRIMEERVINALSLGGRKHDCAFFPSPVHHLQWCSWGSLFLHMQHLQN